MTNNELYEKIDSLINDSNDRHVQRIGMELSKLVYSCLGPDYGNRENDAECILNIIEAVQHLAPNTRLVGANIANPRL